MEVFYSQLRFIYKFLEQSGLSFGFDTEQMSTIVNNIPLTETGISFGVGLPLGGLSNANVGLEISQRGQKESGLLQETLVALTRWFIAK